MHLVTGTLLDVREVDGERVGTLNVRGVRVQVDTGFVPEARPGDRVLVHAGIALSVIREEDHVSRNTGESRRG